MLATGSRIRQIGWLAVLAVCVAAFVLLSFRVQSVRSEVLLAERQIIGLENEVLMLETEFQTRASQRQLAGWNAVELGYEAPRADQFLENDRQLAALGVPAGVNAPEPIRVAYSDPQGAPTRSTGMVSPITGAPVTFASVDAEGDAGAVFTEAFGDFLIDASPIRTANARTANAPSGNSSSPSAEAGQ